MIDPDPASILIALLFAAVIILFQICDEAFSTIGEARIRELEDDGNRRAKAIRQLTENQQRFSFRVRIATSFGAIGLAYCVEYMFANALYHTLRQSIEPAIGTVCTLLLVYLLLALSTAFIFGFFIGFYSVKEMKSGLSCKYANSISSFAIFLILESFFIALLRCFKLLSISLDLDAIMACK